MGDSVTNPSTIPLPPELRFKAWNSPSRKIAKFYSTPHQIHCKWTSLCQSPYTSIMRAVKRLWECTVSNGVRQVSCAFFNPTIDTLQAQLSHTTDIISFLRLTKLTLEFPGIFDNVWHLEVLGVDGRRHLSRKSVLKVSFKRIIANPDHFVGRLLEYVHKNVNQSTSTGSGCKRMPDLQTFGMTISHYRKLSRATLTLDAGGVWTVSTGDRRGRMRVELLARTVLGTYCRFGYTWFWANES